jgi:hypothetical protein
MHDGTVVTARNITALTEISKALEIEDRKMGLRLIKRKTRTILTQMQDDSNLR